MAPKRSKNPEMMMLIAKQIESSQYLMKEQVSNKNIEIKQQKKQFQLEHKKLEFEKMKTEVETKRYNDDLDFRKKQHDDEIQMRKKQHDDEIEARKRQQEFQQEKDEGMLKVFQSFAPIIAQLTEKKSSKKLKKKP